MHQETWVHRHLQACNFVFDPGWRRHRRQWCVHQLFAGRFVDNGVYQKWRVNLRFGTGPGAGGDVTRARAASTNQVCLLESRIGDTSVLLWVGGFRRNRLGDVSSKKAFDLAKASQMKYIDWDAEMVHPVDGNSRNSPRVTTVYLLLASQCPRPPTPSTQHLSQPRHVDNPAPPRLVEPRGYSPLQIDVVRD